ncbi:hypothetical protein V1514DRAFT_334714 [Lipomyces japonicus]|uniref:uncharacterized protein n=1 Tax=Lipomyces japonicus TaxID=56871 RepID=UPI0034CD6D62
MALVPHDQPCDICKDPLWVEAEFDDDDEDHDHHDHDHDGSCGSSTAATAARSGRLLDDVQLNLCPAQHHFHWQCFLTHEQPLPNCPACRTAIVPPDAPLLATVRHESGDEDHDYDLRPALVEERFYASNPQLRMQEALFSACFQGSEDVVLDLVQAEPSIVHAVDIDKAWTALFFAAVAGREGIVRFLVANGADAGVNDKLGKTAADYAADEGHPVIANFITSSA